MKVLHLLRHAKSSWDDPHLPDHDRPLAPRGQRAARKLARHLRDTGVAPALVLCSTARRATETLDAIIPALECAPDVHFEEDLYLASTDELVRCIQAIPAAVPSALLIGHNPSIQAAALVFAEGHGPLVARLRHKMPTGALATLELRGEWSAAVAGAARLVSFVVPRELA